MKFTLSPVTVRRRAELVTDRAVTARIELIQVASFEEVPAKEKLAHLGECITEALRASVEGAVEEINREVEVSPVVETS